MIVAVLGGEESDIHPINTGVPHDSLLGPLMCSNPFDHLLQRIPEAVACADDLTIHLSFYKDKTMQSRAVPDVSVGFRLGD